MEKEKVLLILSGITNSGKTEVLNMIIDFYKIKYPLAELKQIVGNGKLTNLNTDRDKRVVFSSLGIKSIKLGINTVGDDGDAVMKSMELFDVYNCDIVVCPTKTHIKTDNGSTATIQREIFNRNKNTEVIPIFKIMFKKNNHTSNDEFTKRVIIEQLKRFIV